MINDCKETARMKLVCHLSENVMVKQDQGRIWCINTGWSNSADQIINLCYIKQVQRSIP